MAEDIVRQLGYLALGTRLKRLGERLHGDTHRILRSLELDAPAGQFPFLAALDSQGPLTIGGLAQAVGVTQPGATRMVAQLIESGLVTVAPSRDDQRRKKASLTAQGKRLIAGGKKRAWPVIEGAVRDLCRDLHGPLLEQLAAIEERLDAQPLHRRAARGTRR